MSTMSGKEMMAVCEEKGLLVPHDDIPIIGLDGTVVRNTMVNYPAVFAIIVGRPEFFPMSDGRGAGITLNWNGEMGAQAICDGFSGNKRQGFRLNRGKKTPEEFASKFNAAVAWYRVEYETYYGSLPQLTDGGAMVRDPDGSGKWLGRWCAGSLSLWRRSWR